MVEKLLSVAIVAFAVMTPSLGLASGCPTPELARKVREPLKAYQKIEVEAQDQEPRSTEGGVWHVYLTRKGRLHSIVRTDYSETGRLRTRASFMDTRNVGIEVVDESYAEPYYTKRPIKIVSRSRVTYFVCDADVVIHAPVKTAGDGNADKPFLEAKALKALFFNAKELAPHLKLLD